MADLKVGQLDGGYRYLGGDPAAQESWEVADSLKPGDIDGGYMYRGGEPGQKSNWLDIATPRTAFAVANDTVITTANAAAGGVGAIADFFKPGNRLSKFIEEDIVKAGEEKQSDVTKAAKLKFRTELANAKTAGEEAKAVGSYVVENPLQAAAEAGGSIAVPGVAIKGVKGVAAAAGLAEKGLLRAGLAAGAATGASMAGGDAAGNAYDLVQRADLTELKKTKAWQDLEAKGMDETAIRHELGTAAAKDARLLPAIVGGVGGVLGAEKLLAGVGRNAGRVATAVKAGASEALQEGAEEGITQYEGQRAAAKYDASIDPTKGVGGAAAYGAASGGVTGGGVGAITGGHGAEAAPAPEEQPAGPTLGLPNYAGPPIVNFPDGSSMTGAEAEQYRLANMRQPIAPEVAAEAGPPKQLPHYAGPSLVAFEDGSVMTGVEAEQRRVEDEQRRLDNMRQPIEPQPEAVPAPAAPKLLKSYAGPEMVIMGDGTTLTGREYEQMPFERRMSGQPAPNSDVGNPMSEQDQQVASQDQPADPSPVAATKPAAAQPKKAEAKAAAPDAALAPHTRELAETLAKKYGAVVVQHPTKPGMFAAVPAEESSRYVAAEPMKPKAKVQEDDDTREAPVTPAAKSKANTQLAKDIEAKFAAEPAALSRESAEDVAKHFGGVVVQHPTKPGHFSAVPKEEAAKYAAAEPLKARPAEADDDSTDAPAPKAETPAKATATAKPIAKEKPAAKKELPTLDAYIADKKKRAKESGYTRWTEDDTAGATEAHRDIIETALEDGDAVPDSVLAGHADVNAEHQPMLAKKVSAKIEDLGEKIGGARKDTSVKTGSKSPAAVVAEDRRPTWRKRFEPIQALDGGTWAIQDTKTRRIVSRSPYATQEEAERFIPLAAVALKHRVVSTGNKFEIWRDVTDRKRVKVIDKDFDTRDAALDYMANHAAEIIEANTTFGEADLPVPENKKRQGKDRRKGDVEGKDFMHTFGFRGVEFGNWNNQEERQQIMNEAYDGLADLAEVLGIPPKAIGLNGDLALAFGARGQGLNSARAHYERSRAVINLTKMKGAGALAHEWFHALDHYLGRQDGKASSAWERQGDGTRVLPVEGAEDDMASGGFGRKSSVRPELREAYESIIDTMFRKGEKYVEDTRRADEFVGKAREDVARRLDALRKELSMQKDPQYWKRNNKPASAEQLAEFDTVAAKIVAGEALVTNLRETKGGAGKVGYRWSNDALDAISAIHKAVRGRSGFGSGKQGGALDFLMSDMSRYDARLKMLSEAQKGDTKTRKVPTEFAMNAKSLDQGRGQNYWTTPHEMAARAFQGFVHDKIAGADGRSPFLNHAPEGAAIPTPWGWQRPYPHGEERKAINAAMQKFVDTLDAKDTDTGTALYSRSGGWEGFPDVILAGRLGDAGKHVDFAAAKAGDDKAALNVVNDVLSDKTVEEVRKAVKGKNAILVPVHAVEETGQNRIPAALSEVLGDRLGLDVNDKIVQKEKIGRSGKDGMYRLANQPTFDGKVEPRNYVLVDDTLTQGGTFAQLKEHIEANGGKVIAAVALTGKQYSAKMQPNEGDLKTLHEKYDSIEPWWREQFGFGFDGLTASEARYIAGSGLSPEALRDRVGEARRAGVARSAAGDDKGGKDPLDEVLFRLGRKVGGGVSAEEAQTFINDVAKNWENAPKIVVTETPAEWPFKAPENAKGAAHNGRVYIAADNIHSLDQLQFVLFHEALGHTGLRGFFGKDLDQVLLNIWQVNKQVRIDTMMWQESNADVIRDEKLDAQQAKLRGIEEALSDMAGMDIEPSLFKRLISAMQKGLRKLGFDKVADWLESASQAEALEVLAHARRYVERGPVKQAVPDLAPAFSADEKPAFSRHVAGDSGRTYTAGQRQAFSNIGREVETPSLKQRVQSLAANAGKKMTQGIADQFAPLKDLDKQAYLLARMSKGADGALEAMMLYGRPFLNGGVYDVNVKDGGVIDKLLKPLGKETDDFMWWIAGNRAEQLTGEGRENLMSAADIAALKDLAKGQMDFDFTLPNGQKTRNRQQAYMAARDQLNEFNKSVMDIAEQSGLIDGAARKIWERDFYVPFYRESEDSDKPSFPNVKSGLVRQKAFQKLKGGTDKLNSDLLANTMMNWSHILTAAAKNRAAKASLLAAENAGVATSVPTAEKGSVSYKENGADKHFQVDDPFVLDAITALEFAGFNSAAMKAMGAFKRWLTMGVTASPTFKVRNLIRDSISAIGQGELSYNPAKNIKEGLKATDKKSQTFASMLAGGGLIRFGTMLEGNRSDHVRRLVEKGVDPSTILDTGPKWKRMWRRHAAPILDAYNELGDRSEGVNRGALYQQLRNKGMSHAEASMAARDLLDFSMGGTWQSVRFLAQTVPFANARIQGLYKLGRAAKENPKRMAYVVGAVAMASLALLAAYHDDEDWKKREDWDRDNFWWFKVGGKAFRIPKPFEIGAIGTLAERSAELAFDKEMNGHRFGERLGKMVGDTFALNPIPQLFKPMLDVYANTDSFTGRKIETMGMEKLRPEDRFNARTSEIAKLLGKTEALSPVQIDHLIRGYFGWLGTSATTATDQLVRATEKTEKPSMKLKDAFLLGSFVESLPANSSRYVTQMYDQAEEIEEAYASWRHYLKIGDAEKAREVYEAEKDKIKRHGMVNRVRTGMTSIGQQTRRIEASKTMTADQKREALDRLAQQREKLALLLAGRGN